MRKSSTGATIIDIARVARVSFKTVSRVLNDHPTVGAELQLRVRAAMRELDYRPNTAARMLAGPRGYAIALLLSTDDISVAADEEMYLAPFFADLQLGAFLACQRNGYRFVLETVDLASATLDTDLARLRDSVDGVVLVPPTADAIALLDALDACRLPYARIAPGVDPGRGAGVGIDERAAAAAMTSHLLALGHRRISFVSGPQEHVAARARLTGYREALAECAEAPAPSVVSGDFTFPSGMHAGDVLLGAANPPSAIFAANDDMAAGVLAAAHRRDIAVPQRLSVAGFDDSTTARLTWPALTTVRQPLTAMTRAAVDHLIVASQPSRNVGALWNEFPFSIVERDSVAAHHPAEHA